MSKKDILFSIKIFYNVFTRAVNFSGSSYASPWSSLEEMSSAPQQQRKRQRDSLPPSDSRLASLFVHHLRESASTASNNLEISAALSASYPKGISSAADGTSQEEMREELASRFETLESSLEYLRRQTGVSIPVTSALLQKFEKIIKDGSGGQSSGVGADGGNSGGGGGGLRSSTGMKPSLSLAFASDKMSGVHSPLFDTEQARGYSLSRALHIRRLRRRLLHGKDSRAFDAAQRRCIM